MFLLPEQVTTAVLEWRAGEPIVDAPVWFGGVELNEQGSNRPADTARLNGRFANYGLRRTDANGRVTLPYATDFPLSVAVLLPHRELAALERRHGTPICPLALLYARVSSQVEVHARVSELRPVRFTIEHDDRRPVPTCASVVATLPASASTTSSVSRARSRWCLPVQGDIMLAVWHEQAGDVVRVAVPRVRGGDAVATAHVRLPKPVHVTGTVVDVDGRPIAGASVRLGTTLGGRRSEWQSVASDESVAEPRVVARGYYYPPMAEAMFQRSLRTDKDGPFALCCRATASRLSCDLNTMVARVQPSGGMRKLRARVMATSCSCCDRARRGSVWQRVAMHSIG